MHGALMTGGPPVPSAAERERGPMHGALMTGGSPVPSAAERERGPMRGALMTDGSPVPSPACGGGMGGGWVELVREARPAFAFAFAFMEQYRRRTRSHRIPRCATLR